MHATITTKKKNNHCHFTKKTHEIKVNLNHFISFFILFITFKYTPIPKHFISYVHGYLVWIYV